MQELRLLVEPSHPLFDGLLQLLEPLADSHEGEPLGESLPRLSGGGLTSELVDRVLGQGPELVVMDRVGGGADDQEPLWHQPSLGEVEDPGQELSPRQIPGGAEQDDQMVGGSRKPARPRGRFTGGSARHGQSPALRSTCPPNCFRIADSSWSAKSASPRELNLSYRAVLRTPAGTPSSTAAITVHGPSRESETRPAKPCRPGDSTRAAAVRSKSHDATTLPRRQSSDTAATSRSYR